MSGLARRLIPCLDTREGRVVKGISFERLYEVGSPVDLARRYEADGADELVVLDIAATPTGRATLPQVVQDLAEALSIPLTAGGGIRGAEDADRLFRSGADKVAVNSAAVRRPELLAELSDRYGRQAVVLSADVREEPEGYRVYVSGGQVPTGLDLWEWLDTAVRMGIGELLLTSIDRDGRQGGYDVALTEEAAKRVPVPVIASGGARGIVDVEEIFLRTGATGALLASSLHQGKVRLTEIRERLRDRGVQVRWTV